MNRLINCIVNIEDFNNQTNPCLKNNIVRYWETKKKNLLEDIENENKSSVETREKSMMIVVFSFQLLLLIVEIVDRP